MLMCTTAWQDIFREMSADMDGSRVPVEWGGASDAGVYDSQEEHAIRALVHKLNHAGS
jgi:hypothetical protein